MGLWEKVRSDPYFRTKMASTTGRLQTIALSEPFVNAVGKKLQEILDNTTAFMKGKKSLRSTEEERKAFDQSLDILAELGKCNGHTKAAAQQLLDRTNEVRIGHNSDYVTTTLGSYGEKNIAKHTNLEDEETVSRYQAKFAKPKQPVGKEYVHRVFEPYPDQDFTQLERVPKGIAAIKVRHAIQACNDFMSDKQMSKPEAANQLATILALSECQMYFRERKTIGMSDVVINSADYNVAYMKYMTDPALQKLSEKYRDPAERKKSSSGTMDSFTLAVDKLKKEYKEMKQELENGKKENDPQPEPGVPVL